MTDLILHAGLPKTGTSTVQAHVLAGRPNFLGKEKYNRCLSGSSLEARHLLALTEAIQWEPESTVRTRAREWAARCGRLIQKSFPDQSQQPEVVVLSEEKLVTWPFSPLPGSRWPITTGWNPLPETVRSRPAPLIRLIREHGSALWPYGRIRILLTLRNQADWLASHYSQLSARIRNASQQDFEERIERLTTNGDPFLDWSSWVDDLASSVGPDNLQTLLLEEMEEQHFWTRLSEFLNSKDLPIERLATGRTKRNVRQHSEPGQWKLRKLRVKKALTQNWPIEKMPPGSKVALAALRRTEGFLARPILQATTDRKRDRRIRMDENLQELILERMRPANERLAERLGKDLHALGYLPSSQGTESLK